jgi:hypothetical protein
LAAKLESSIIAFVQSSTVALFLPGIDLFHLQRKGDAISSVWSEVFNVDRCLNIFIQAREEWVRQLGPLYI